MSCLIILQSDSLAQPEWKERERERESVSEVTYEVPIIVVTT
jgi:hypothetical protein